MKLTGKDQKAQDSSLDRKSVEAMLSHRSNVMKSTRDSMDIGLVNAFKDLMLVDVHNHDAVNRFYRKSKKIWDDYAVDKVVLFGAISSPEAVKTDSITWEAYREYPERIIPFFSGFNIQDKSCIDVVKSNLEKGYIGIGEFVAASTKSPVCSILPWKGIHAMDGYFPDIYQICAEYKAPILLHIDPSRGTVLDTLIEACKTFPSTHVIFAHGNAFNSAENLKRLIMATENLYIDFFAGFQVYNTQHDVPLDTFIDVIQSHPDRFFVSTDSGYDITYDQAYYAIYLLLSKLKESTAEKVAGNNFLKLIQDQSPTKKQLGLIRKLYKEEELPGEIGSLTKLSANNLIFGKTASVT